MKKLYKIFVSASLTAIILLLLFVVFRLRNGSDESKTTSSIDSLVIIHRDSTQHVSKEKRGLPAVNNYYYNYQAIDTAAVLKDYFMKRTVKDLLENDTLVITTIDTLHKNNIVSRRQSWKLKIPLSVEKTYTVTNNTETVKYSKGFYAGPFANMDFTTGKIRGAGGEINFVTRRNNFGAGVDVVNRSATVKILFRIQK
jgi:hypothetical protein